jgi:hypothetical protein
VDERPVVHGRFLRLESDGEDGAAEASVFVFDTGAIVIEGPRSPLSERLERWKERVLEAR